jgi:multidrug efflux pump subunit AcrA (membrane-fusion protein)
VFAVGDGPVRLRWVAVGAREGERVEIRAGLEAGERVVLDPVGLADGEAVRERGAMARLSPDGK